MWPHGVKWDYLRKEDMNMKKKVIVTSLPVALMASIPALASEPGTSGTANSAVVTALTGTANDMVATGTSLIPVALTVVGLSMAVIFGIRLFKKIAK